MHEIDINNVTLPGNALGVRGAALRAYQHQTVTLLVSRDVPVAEIAPVNRSVYTALLDSPGQNSGHIGVFTTEELARAACQEHKDEDDEVSGAPKGELAWKDDSAEAPDGDKYVVVMTSLDVPTGMG